jgi:hypothetical protein
MDVRDITAVIGRVRTRDEWWIVDQFDSCAIPTFGEDGEEEDDGQEGSDTDDD